MINVSKYKKRFNRLSIKNETLKDKYIELLEEKIENCISKEEFSNTIKSFKYKINKLERKINTLKGGDVNDKSRIKRAR